MVNDVPFGFGVPDPDDPKKPSDAPVDPLTAMFGGAGAADLGAALQRFGQLLSTSSGPVHWQLAHDTARQLVAANGDPSVSSVERAAVVEAVEIAQVWLDDKTSLPSVGVTAQAWSRAEWVEQTLPRWKALVLPLAERMAQASAEAMPAQMPEEMRAMAAPLMGMMGQMSGVMFGGQVGQGLGALAQEVLTASDVGIPLAPTGVAALVPRNVGEFGGGLGIPDDQVRIYLALRECAHVRLFQHASWLTSRIEAAIADYASGISVDMAGIEQALGGIDPSTPQAMEEIMSSGVFEPPATAEQQAALERLEHLLALVEGWVDDVTSDAADTRLPAAGALREAMRRRRATGGPAERTFGTLVGLSLRPRRLREASSLWRALAEHRTIAERDALWSHPDLLPDGAALDDPIGFATKAPSSDWDISTITDAEPPDEQPAPGE